MGIALVNSVFQNGRQYGRYIQNGYSANTKVDDFQIFFLELCLLCTQNSIINLVFQNGGQHTSIFTELGHMIHKRVHGAQSQHKLVRSDLNIAANMTGNMAANIDLYLKGPMMVATIGIGKDIGLYSLLPVVYV